MVYSTLSSPESAGAMVPFYVGQVLACLSSSLLCHPRLTRFGLVAISAITTVMVIYSSYLTGGVGNVTLTWFVALPMIVAVFAGTLATIVTSSICVAALCAFGVLEHSGHEFPMIATQTPGLWVAVTTWAVITTAGIAIFSNNRFQRTVAAYESEIARRTRVEQTLRRAQQRLRLAKGAAEAGASAKGAFLAQVSHEIRNPLTAIMGTIDLLELPANDDLRKTRIDLLRRSADTLLELVDEVLDFSKMEAGRITLNPKAIDPRSLAEEVERSYRAQAMERGLELYLELAPDLPDTVNMDALRVRQVLANLMSNAIKFTPSGSITIEVWSGHDEDGEATISFGIEDSGIGIPDEAKDQIFEPYVQAERSTTEQYGGTGLGLPICSRLVALMGGVLGLESEQGEGTRFWFSIPVDMSAIAPAALEEPAVQTTRASVLVVEDDALNRQVVGDLLRSLGHSVTVASSGREGIEAYAKNQPDLVLMDIQMPEMNGMEASIQIRAWETENGAHRVPILAMTADVEVHRVARYGEAGMNDLLGKPISREKLETAVNGWAVHDNDGPESPA
jgi:signal transduction histidine kinase/ActR/RegA family two-component response regulator